jgi:hypothetical protein
MKIADFISLYEQLSTNPSIPSSKELEKIRDTVNKIYDEKLERDFLIEKNIDGNLNYLRQVIKTILLLWLVPLKARLLFNDSTASEDFLYDAQGNPVLSIRIKRENKKLPKIVFKRDTSIQLWNISPEVYKKHTKSGHTLKKCTGTKGTKSVISLYFDDPDCPVEEARAISEELTLENGFGILKIDDAGQQTIDFYIQFDKDIGTCLDTNKNRHEPTNLLKLEVKKTGNRYQMHGYPIQENELVSEKIKSKVLSKTVEWKKPT